MKKEKLSVIKKNFDIPFKIILSLVIFSGFVFLIRVFDARAETIQTSVSVGNAAPEFTVNPFEDPASSSTSPTNVGSNVTWKATAEDANGDDYYLIVCSTNSVSAGSGAPTCGATTWCTSSATTSGQQASCNRTALAGDAHENAWFAFVCDGIGAGAACSTAHQGTGDSGSPFFVNHAPSFTAANNNSPQNPGVNITWTTTASDPNNYDIKLLVCQSEGISGGSCSGDEWCSSNFVASNPTCSYEIPIPTAAGSNNAYVYIIDEFNFPAGGQQGSNVPFNVNNVAPVVTAVTINGGSAITLEAGTTKAVSLTATVTDNNGFDDIASVLGYAYRSGVGFANCDSSGDADANNCYPEVSCSVDGTPSSTSADYICTVNLQYFADATVANTQFPDQNWLSTIRAVDDGSLSGSLEVPSGVNVNSLLAFDITESINYGGRSVGFVTDLLDVVVTTTAIGNTGVDQEHSGSPNMCVNFPACTGGTPIGVAFQRYALSVSTAYSSGTALSTTPADVFINVPKPTSTTASTRNTWWGIEIPAGTEAGSYTGENTITGVVSDVEDW